MSNNKPVNEIGITSENFAPKVVMSWRDKVSHESATHTHEFLMIYYVAYGKNEVTVNGETMRVQKGDVILVNPNVPHGRKKGDSAFFILGIDNLQLCGMELDHLPFPGGSPLVRPVRYSQEIYDCYRRIAEVQDKKEVGWDLMCNVLCQEFLVWVLKEITPAAAVEKEQGFRLKGYEKENVVQMIVDYMKENYVQHISVDEIARHAFMSVTYVTKIFREIMGDTPINYLISIRLGHAAELLKEGNLTIQAVSKQVGYDDPYYFSKLFKRRYGVSPTEYKNRYRMGLL